MVVIEVAVVDLATKSLWGCWDRNRLIIIKIFLFFKLTSRCSVRCVSVFLYLLHQIYGQDLVGEFSARYRHLSVGACCFSESLKDTVA